MVPDRRFLLVLVLGLSVGVAGAQEESAPLSAIPWLSETLAAPQPETASPAAPPRAPEKEAAPIEVTPLGPPDAGAAGLLTPAAAGLPGGLWAGGDPATLTRAIRAMPVHDYPALRDVFRAMMLVEAAPPEGGGGSLFLARIDALLVRGDLAPAQALIERAGPDSPELFRRWFDILLLTGTEDRACATLQAKPNLSPNYATRIFCLARQGRWYTAALTLETATALGAIGEAERNRLAAFLDPELIEGELPPPRPNTITPLDYKLLEAVGMPVPTGHLPLAFAHIDLRHVVGWKAQIDAAERLARAGALDPNRLLGIYTARLPAASGGVWDRVALVQDLDIALTADNAADIARLLPRLRAQMRAAGLEPVAARLFAPRLAYADLDGKAAQHAYELALMSNTSAAFAAPPANLPRETAFAAALAQGTAPDVAAPKALADALHRGLTAEGLPDRYADLPVGAALLDALKVLAAGPRADPADAGDAIALLSRTGPENAARHAALQLMTLGPAE
jgi:hypothetical protein